MRDIAERVHVVRRILEQQRNADNIQKMPDRGYSPYERHFTLSFRKDRPFVPESVQCGKDKDRGAGFIEHYVEKACIKELQRPDGDSRSGAQGKDHRRQDILHDCKHGNQCIFLRSLPEPEHGRKSGKNPRGKHCRRGCQRSALLQRDPVGQVHRGMEPAQRGVLIEASKIQRRAVPLLRAGKPRGKRGMNSPQQQDIGVSRDQIGVHGNRHIVRHILRETDELLRGQLRAVLSLMEKLRFKRSSV